MSYADLIWRHDPDRPRFADCTECGGRGLVERTIGSTGTHELPCATCFARAEKALAAK